MKDMGALLQYVFSGESAGALVLPHHHELVKDSISKLAEAVASAREVEEGMLPTHAAVTSGSWYGNRDRSCGRRRIPALH